MVRTGNEDAFALLHACESRQDDLGESALVLLCDGMGGYEAGEVAAALAIQVLRKNLLAAEAVRRPGRRFGFPTDALAPRRTEGHAGTLLDVEAVQEAAQGRPEGGQQDRSSPPRAHRRRSGAAWAARPRSSTSTAATSSSATSATAGPITCTRAG